MQKMLSHPILLYKWIIFILWNISPYEVVHTSSLLKKFACLLTAVIMILIVRNLVEDFLKITSTFFH